MLLDEKAIVLNVILVCINIISRCTYLKSFAALEGQDMECGSFLAGEVPKSMTIQTKTTSKYHHDALAGPRNLLTATYLAFRFYSSSL